MRNTKDHTIAAWRMGTRWRGALRTVLTALHLPANRAV
jgi:hypothetical protein